MNPQRLEILIACLRRIDSGDAVEAVLRDYPEETYWLREHLSVSGALQAGCRPPAEKRDLTRESLLSAVAHSNRPASVATAQRFRLTVGPAVFMILLGVGVTAGAAAASGLNLHAVAREVADTLVEPLPVSAPHPLQAEAPQDSIALGADELAAADDAASGKRLDVPPNDGNVSEKDATLPGSPSVVVPDDPNVLIQAGQSDESPPPKAPTSNNGNPEDDDAPSGEDQGGDDGPPPGQPGQPSPTPNPGGPPGGEDQGADDAPPPGQPGQPSPTPNPGGPPGGNGQPGPNGPAHPGGNGQPGGNGSNGNGSEGGQPGGSTGNPANGSDGSNGNPSNGSGCGGSNDGHNGGSSGSGQSGKGAGGGGGRGGGR